jgi:2-keto-4-pentenoate hydratase/2-oxohepta-3-ene-1,7-dioic acid hydratase in catechol pathway
VKLARFEGGRIGVVTDAGIVDVSAVCGVDADAWPPVGMNRVIAAFPTLRARIDDALPGAQPVPLAQVRLETPIPWPHNLYALGNNYTSHAAEMAARKASTAPPPGGGFFLKAASSLVGPSDEIVLPDRPGREIHYECELAVVIGKRGRNVVPSEAMRYVFGYACLIDVTLRGTEERPYRKSFDTFTPLGPWIVTADEVGDPADVAMNLWLNGELRQHAFVREMVMGIPEAIAMCSEAATIEPGDVIATGTMAGVGMLAPGDRVRIAIDRVGAMELPVVTRTAAVMR